MGPAGARSRAAGCFSGNFRRRFDGYSAALRRHYKEGPPANWQESYVSAYATAHPWEDFAETWVHYLHIVDTLEMAGNFGMQIAPAADRIGGLRARVEFDPYATEDFDAVTLAWFPFVLAMNSLSRTIGTRDMYPFLLTGPVIGKLALIHELVQRERSMLPPAPAAGKGDSRPSDVPLKQSRL